MLSLTEKHGPEESGMMKEYDMIQIFICIMPNFQRYISTARLIEIVFGEMKRNYLAWNLNCIIYGSATKGMRTISMPPRSGYILSSCPLTLIVVIVLN